MAVLVLVPALGSAKDLEISSVWTATPVKVDGSGAKWSALVKPLGESPMSLGVQNDGDYLYVCVETSDQRTGAQLGRAGLTVWVNGAGAAQRTFGVRFPLGMGLQRTSLDRGRQTPQSRGQARPPVSARVPKDFELIGPTEKDRHRVRLGGDQPIAAALGNDSGVTLVELRIPLRPSDSHPLAAGAAPGAAIALGLTTEWPGHSRGSGARPYPTPAVQLGSPTPVGGAAVSGGGAPTGQTATGAPGGTGAGRDVRAGGGPRGGHDLAADVNLWVRVSLATPPAPQKKGSRPTKVAPTPAAKAPGNSADTPVPPAAAPAPTAGTPPPTATR